MEAVYVVHHVHLMNDEEDVKLIGVYTTEQRRVQPGFCDTPEGFSIDRYALNQDHWTAGYITVSPDDSECDS